MFTVIRCSTLLMMCLVASPTKKDSIHSVRQRLGRLLNFGTWYLRITKMLSSLCECTGWSVLLQLTNNVQSQDFPDDAHMHQTHKTQIFCIYVFAFFIFFQTRLIRLGHAFLKCEYVYFLNNLCAREVNALARVCDCAGPSEPSMLTRAINNTFIR